LYGFGKKTVGPADRRRAALGGRSDVLSSVRVSGVEFGAGVYA
jgi:hypothetical protein